MKRNCAIFAYILIVLQTILIFGSWIVSAAIPDSQVRPLIGAGGLRWFFSSFAQDMASPLLVYIILLTLTVNVFVNSGLIELFSQNHKINMQKRFALNVVLVELCTFIVLIVLLTAIPHAVLLSVTGELFPSSFSSGLIPMLCLLVTIMSISYGLVSGSLRGFYDIWNSITTGSNYLPPVCFVYILLLQLVSSLSYVLGN